jgi:Bacterial archaeo-eukaryotic release factor family 10
MSPAADSLPSPTRERASELLAWRPEGGVLSVYLRIEPGDRSARWRTELRNGLAETVRSESADQAGDGTDLQRTASRLERKLDADPPHADIRGLIGFVEIAHGPAEERWYASRIPPVRTEVVAGPGSRMGPLLLQMLDDGAPLGVAVTSADRIRLFGWELGRLQEIHDWELSYFADQWRERKARAVNPARGDAVSASGRDRHHQRLEANRERFNEQAGGLARNEAAARSWGRVLIFGDERYAGPFEHGFGPNECELEHAGDADLVTEPAAGIARRVAEMLPGLNRRRERELIDRIKEAAYKEGRAALAAGAVMESLENRRVEHLVCDPDVPGAERMIGLALASNAAVTPVEDEAAEALAEHDGAIALLRY